MPWEGCGVGDDADLDMPGLLGEGGRPETKALVSDEHVLCPAAVLGPAFYEKGAVRRRGPGMPAVQGSTCIHL